MIRFAQLSDIDTLIGFAKVVYCNDEDGPLLANYKKTIEGFLASPEKCGVIVATDESDIPIGCLMVLPQIEGLESIADFCFLYVRPGSPHRTFRHLLRAAWLYAHLRGWTRVRHSYKVGNRAANFWHKCGSKVVYQVCEISMNDLDAALKRWGT